MHGSMTAGKAFRNSGLGRGVVCHQGGRYSRVLRYHSVERSSAYTHQQRDKSEGRAKAPCLTPRTVLIAINYFYSSPSDHADPVTMECGCSSVNIINGGWGGGGCLNVSCIRCKEAVSYLQRKKFEQSTFYFSSLRSLVLLTTMYTYRRCRLNVSLVQSLVLLPTMNTYRRCRLNASLVRHWFYC